MLVMWPLQANLLPFDQVKKLHFFCPISITELLEFSEDRNPWESVEDKLNAIR